MYYNLICEKTEEATKLVTETILNLYEKYKFDEKIFPKEMNKNNKPSE
jgi:hypothetical protein